MEVHERLIPFLESPASYPHRPPEIRSIQTHISWVFIAPPFVFKVKKAVNFGFLDFSTLEKRRHFCQRELELNRRLCPEIYLGVVPIYTSASGFSFKAEGEIVEYSVKMKLVERRRGNVFVDRYHAEKITNPRQARRALAYVLNNWRKHFEDRDGVASTWNGCSSG